MTNKLLPNIYGVLDFVRSLEVLKFQLSLSYWGLPNLKRVVFHKGGFGGCSPGTKTGTKVHSDVLLERKPERGYIRMFPRKTGTGVHSDVPPEQKPERGHIRQNRPFTKPPFCLPVTVIPSE